MNEKDLNSDNIKPGENKEAQKGDLFKCDHYENFPRELLGKISDGLIVYNEQGLLYANPPMVERLGKKLNDISHESISSFFAPEYRERVNDLLTSGMCNEFDLDILNHTGDRIPVRLTCEDITVNDDRMKLLTFKNNSEARKLKETLKDSGKKFRTLIKKSSEVIGVIDSDGLIEYLSDSIEDIFGYSPFELTGTDFFEKIVEDERSKVVKDFNKCLYSRNLYITSEFRYMHKDKYWCHAEIIFSNLMQDNLINGIVFNLKDITEKKKAVNLAAHLQLHDAMVTKLPNIGFLKNRLLLELIKVQEREAENEKLIGVMSIGIDRFKNINNLYGPETGDKLLNSIAQRLRLSYREDDVVARFGGDVFVILLTNIARDFDLKEIIQKTLGIFKQPFVVDKTSMNINVSLGLSLYPYDGGDADILINNSQAAMYKVKESGGGSYSLFDNELHETLINNLQMELELEFALRHDEFLSYYQPKFDKNGELVSIESLIRWESEKRGIVSPGEFIPLVEKNGMIVDIGYNILRKACEQAMEWSKLNRNITMCVNVSPAQFKCPDLVEKVEEIIKETGIDTEFLELEITESGIMENAREGLFKLFKIRSLGVKIAMDDFGTGLSSLSNLISYPIDILKIDKSFVDRLPDNEEARIVVNSIIDLSGNLGFKVVAEGIEHQKQLDYLKERNCDMFQGYYFSKPLPPEEFEEKYFK
jgi:diguanylate cyclase (GGDEF)-like protein/PAS domain S-box-containing protein